LGKYFDDQEEVYQYFVTCVHWLQLITTGNGGHVVT